MVAPGKGYNVFAGRDASKALGKSSMKPEDLSADYSELTAHELKVLDDWLAYYTKVRHFMKTVRGSRIRLWDMTVSILRFVGPG